MDLGCGPGNSTELIVQRYPGATVVGTDNSPAMIEAARQRLQGLAFELGDITGWQPTEAPDLVYAWRASGQPNWHLARPRPAPRPHFFSRGTRPIR